MSETLRHGQEGGWRLLAIRVSRASHAPTCFARLSFFASDNASKERRDVEHHIGLLDAGAAAALGLGLDRCCLVLPLPPRATISLPSSRAL